MLAMDRLPLRPMNVLRVALRCESSEENRSWEREKNQSERELIERVRCEIVDGRGSQLGVKKVDSLLIIFVIEFGDVIRRRKSFPNFQMNKIF